MPTIEERIEALQQGIQGVEDRLSKFNPYHKGSGPGGGQFTSGGGGKVGGGGKGSIADVNRLRRLDSDMRGPINHVTESLTSAYDALFGGSSEKALPHLASAGKFVLTARDMARGKGKTGAAAYLDKTHGDISHAKKLMTSGDRNGALNAIRSIKV